MKETLKKEGKEGKWTDWDKEIKEYRRKLDEEEKEKENRIARANKSRTSWEIIRACREIVKENSKTWKESKERIEAEELKQGRIQLAKKKKKEYKEREIQKKMLKTWLTIPPKEREKYRMKEEKTSWGRAVPSSVELKLFYKFGYN